MAITQTDVTTIVLNGTNKAGGGLFVDPDLAEGTVTIKLGLAPAVVAVATHEEFKPALRFAIACARLRLRFLKAMTRTDPAFLTTHQDLYEETITLSGAVAEVLSDLAALKEQEQQVVNP